MERVPPHKHNGTDAERIEFTDISILGEAAIADPVGGATIDANARTAILAILEALRAKGIIKES